MEITALFDAINLFSQETHGKTDLGKELIWVQGNIADHFAPVKHLIKMGLLSETNPVTTLMKAGFVYQSQDFADSEPFRKWYEFQFQKKLTSKSSSKIHILYLPDHLALFQSLVSIHREYALLKSSSILINGKNLPVQLGEWYAKAIFGLVQVKSSSQRGFDFELNGKKVEVKVHWSDVISPKGMKIKRTSLELCDNVILVYLFHNFLIRDLCFLDSEFIKRKFLDKGHFVFLKDREISQYFFSRSSHHMDKVVNQLALMKFADSSLAVKLIDKID